MSRADVCVACLAAAGIAAVTVRVGIELGWWT